MQPWEQAWANVGNPTASKPQIQTAATLWGSTPDPLGQQVINQQALADEQYRQRNAGIYEDLVGAGYSGPYISQKNWGAYDSMGGIGEAEANKRYQELLAHGKATGDWSGMVQFMDAADAGDRKYHRGGFLGTGFNPFPSNILEAGLLFGGAAAGLGAFKGLGIPGLVPGSGVGETAVGTGTGGVTSFPGNTATGASNIGDLGSWTPLSESASGVGATATGAGFTQPSATGIANAALSGGTATTAGSLGTVGALGGTAPTGLAATAASTAAGAAGTTAASTFSTLKSAASALSLGKNIIGGLIDLKSGLDAKDAASGLQAAAGPDPQSERIKARLEEFFNDPSTADVDQRWLDQLAKDYTRTASAKQGVDSGAYIEGLVDVLNRGRLTWLQSRESAGRGLLASNQSIIDSAFDRQTTAMEANIFADAMRAGGAATVASSALDFMFDIFDDDK